jgi:hypothetical protein
MILNEMFDSIFIILSLLLIKHCYIDFVNQTSEEISRKGIYGDWVGLGHSIKHGLGTLFVLACFVDFWLALFLGFIDFVIHYHIDWIKVKFGSKDMTSQRFWAEFGLDQLAHNLTYVYIVWLLL